jgi:hypothetical protein
MESNPTNPNEPQITPLKPGQTIGPEAAPSTPTPPVSEASQPVVSAAVVPPTPATPAPVVGSPTSDNTIPPTLPNQPPVPGTKKKGVSKRLLLAIIVIVLLVGGVAAAYFGYYKNPSVILSQSLDNTSKGYDKLIDYANTQAKTDYKGVVTEGTYSFKNGDTTTDGSLSYKSDGQASEATFDIGLGVTRVEADVMTIPAKSGSTPDVYLKASGLQGLGTLLGSAELNSTLNQLSDKWIVIDHTLIDNIANSAGASTEADIQPPSRQQIFDELEAFGKVNKDYLFTTDKDKSVTTVVKKIGAEEVDGHSTYHYKMGFNKDNVKKYITAQQNALNASQLGAWIKKNDYEKTVNKAFDDMKDSANDISSKDTFDLWTDTDKRIVYKIRVADTDNAATNYADIGLNYTGGDNYPFFLTGVTDTDGDTTSSKVTATLNTKTNSLKFVADLTGESSGSNYSFKLDATSKPSNETLKLKAPSGAQPLSQVLDQAGLGGLLEYYTQQASASASSSQLLLEENNTTQLQ